MDRPCRGMNVNSLCAALCTMLMMCNIMRLRSGAVANNRSYMQIYMYY